MSADIMQTIPEQADGLTEEEITQKQISYVGEIERRIAFLEQSVEQAQAEIQRLAESIFPSLN